MLPHFFASVPCKASTKILATIKTSSDPVKSEFLFRSRVANVLASDGKDSEQHFWSLSNPTKRRYCANCRNARPAATVQQQARRTRSLGLVNSLTISCSKSTLLCSGGNIFCIQNPKGASCTQSLLDADKARCPSRSSTVDETTKSGSLHCGPLWIILLAMAIQHVRNIWKFQPQMC